MAFTLTFFSCPKIGLWATLSLTELTTYLVTLETCDQRDEKVNKKTMRNTKTKTKTITITKSTFKKQIQESCDL